MKLLLLALLVPSATTAFLQAPLPTSNSLPSTNTRIASSTALSAASSSSSSSSSDHTHSRRDALNKFTTTLAATAAFTCLSPFLNPPTAALAASSSSKASPSPYPAQVTDKVYFDVRITGFVTGEEKATNEDFKGRLVFGLFGKDAPLIVQQFLSYVKQPYGGEFPTYAFSSFIKCEPGTIVQVGRIKGLKQLEIAGSRQYEFYDRLLGAKGVDDPKLVNKHDRRGLLTKSSASDAVDPAFGITLAPLPRLDNGDSVVFGMVLEGQDALDAIASTPVYTFEATGEQPKALDDIFVQQKKLFLSVAKNVLNDERAVDRSGAFLKRVEVLEVGVL